MKVVIEKPSSLDVREFKGSASGLEVEPMFYNTKDPAVVGIIRVLSANDDLLFTGLLRVSGKTGQVKIIPRQTPITPPADEGE